ncbi:MAG: O-antigen ligase family protein [Caldilineaceae bacterium]
MKSLLQVEPFWVLLLGIPITLAGKLFPIAWHPYWMIALFLFWPLRLLYCRRLLAATPLNWPVYFIILWLPVNLWAATDSILSWQTTGYLLFGVALFAACINWKQTQEKPLLIATLLITIGFLITLASPLLLTLKPFRLFDLTLYSTLTSISLSIGETLHPNVLAGVLILFPPFLITIIFYAGTAVQIWLRYLCSMIGLFMLVVIGITQSRGGYLGLVVGLLSVFILYRPQVRYLIVVTLFCAMAFSIWGNTEKIFEQLSSVGSLGGWEVRLEIWIDSLFALHDFAFTGIGIGMFTKVVPQMFPPRLNIEGYPHAHNLLLQIGLDLGLPGLIAYISILLNLGVMLVASLRRSTTALERALTVGAAGSLTAMLVHGLLDAVTWGTKFSFAPWLLFAFITNHYLKIRQA